MANTSPASNKTDSSTVAGSPQHPAAGQPELTTNYELRRVAREHGSLELLGGTAQPLLGNATASSKAAKKGKAAFYTYEEDSEDSD